MPLKSTTWRGGFGAEVNHSDPKRSRPTEPEHGAVEVMELRGELSGELGKHKHKKQNFIDARITVTPRSALPALPAPEAKRDG